MIPAFPKFQKITVDLKEDIEDFVKQHSPYSDYNFVSLFSYNTLEKNEISSLNNNLVIKFHDYITLEPFFSFIGEHKIKETIQALIQHAKEKGVKEELKLIPSFIIEREKDIENLFSIQEDNGNADYILSVDDISSLKGNKYGAKRNFVNRFLKTYAHHKVVELSLGDKQTQKDIEDLFYRWEKQHEKTRDETEIELTAIQRLLTNLSHLAFISLGLYVDTVLVGFSINEAIHDRHGIIHFEKADISYIGSFQYLKQVTAQYLQKHGCLYINYEQDLGIEGLRKAKLAWHPVKYLKKYTISPKGDL